MSEVGEELDKGAKSLGRTITGFAHSDLGGFLIDTAVNWASLGTVGYDKDTGGIKKGVLVHAADETLGEVSGRNIRREEMYKAEVARQKEEAKRDKLISDERMMKQKQDIQVSKNAAAYQSSIGYGPKPGTIVKRTEDDFSKDFLGL